MLCKSIFVATTVLALSTGNILVIDTGFDDGAVADVGAIYLYSPTGTVISTLKGSTAGDQIGNSTITDLGNGNVVVLSTLWDNTGAVDAGAITFINGTTGVSGGAGRSLQILSIGFSLTGASRLPASFAAFSSRSTPSAVVRQGS